MEPESQNLESDAAATRPRSVAIAKLSDMLDMPVVSVVSGWIGDRRVDFGEDALRAFLHVFDAELAASSQPCDEVAVFLVGRGGYPEFAQGLCRAFRGRKIRATAVIPTQINGTLALAALGMSERVMHPYAALGAYDCPPLCGARSTPGADTLRELDALCGQDQRARQPDSSIIAPADLVAIANQRSQARRARQVLGRLLNKAARQTGVDADAEIGAGLSTQGEVSARVESALSWRALGDRLALSASELDALGVRSRSASSASSALIWELFESYERDLNVLRPAVPRYTESAIADEVEFTPAMEITGAVIEGAHQKFVYELDTGRPDPETGVLNGAWNW